MGLLLGFGSSRAPRMFRETTTTTPTTAALRPRARPRPMARVHQDREVRGFEDPDLLEVDAAPVEPLDNVFALPRPRVRGPFSMRTESVRQTAQGEIRCGGYDLCEMPNLLRLAFKHAPPDNAPYPFSVPQIRALPEVDLNVPVTFFVGENGSGKSTLLEGIAAAAELPAVGSSQVAQDDTLGPARVLGSALRLSWTQRSRKGLFLRAEDFFGSLRAEARDHVRELREKREALTGIRADVPRLAPLTPNHPDEQDAGRVVGQYDSRSHGESFMDLFQRRIRAGGLHLLDEPEAPLSPKRQIALLDVIVGAAKRGAQFIIATHSPILLSCPEARIYSFDRIPIAEVEYGDLEHVVVTRDFLNDPSRFSGRPTRD